MKVLVRKSNNLVVAILNDEDGLGFCISALKNIISLYHESDDTVVGVGYTCTINQDNSRSYSP